MTSLIVAFPLKLLLNLIWSLGTAMVLFGGVGLSKPCKGLILYLISCLFNFLDHFTASNAPRHAQFHQISCWLIRFPELPVIDRCHAYAIRTKYSYKCVNCGYTIGKYCLILF